MSIKIEAAERLRATKLAGYDAETLDLRIVATPEAMKTLVNLLAAIQYNTNIGHSVMLASFFDGDGQDKVSFEGLPENLGIEMSDAAREMGDGYMQSIQSDVAFAHNYRYQDGDHNGSDDVIVGRKLAYKEE